MDSILVFKLGVKKKIGFMRNFLKFHKDLCNIPADFTYNVETRKEPNTSCFQQAVS